MDPAGQTSPAKSIRSLFNRRAGQGTAGQHGGAACSSGETAPAPPRERSLSASRASSGQPHGASHSSSSSSDRDQSQHHHPHQASSHANPIPEPQVQRLLVEGILEKPFVEGEIWYNILMEWVNQWKRHVGILPPRKHYHHRHQPGHITTMKDTSAGYCTAKVHADAWRLLVAWYGLAEGHKVIKQVAYTYGNRTEIENNFNTFDLMLGCAPPSEEHRTDSATPAEDKNEFDPSLPCHLVIRLTKMEKVGHIEWKARQLYHVPSTRASRMWGKTSNTDAPWRPLFRREAAVGKALELESDFLRCSLMLEVADEEGGWVNAPGQTVPLPEGFKGTGPSGSLVERSFFEDVTTGWEHEVHQQIERIGKSFMRQVHGSLSGLMLRARDFVSDRESSLRDRERALASREESLGRREEQLAQRQADLNEALRDHSVALGQLEQRRADHMKEIEEERKRHLEEIDEAHWRLQQARDVLDQEKQTFQTELQRMSELNAVQESRIKLDIGGAIFMTSRLTLTRDPDSMLAAMFSGRHQLSPEPDGSYFVDRDGTHFRYILNYLRDGGMKDGTLPPNEALWRELFTEAEYYQITGLQDYLQGILSQSVTGRDAMNRLM